MSCSPTRGCIVRLVIYDDRLYRCAPSVNFPRIRYIDERVNASLRKNIVIRARVRAWVISEPSLRRTISKLLREKCTHNVPRSFRRGLKKNHIYVYSGTTTSRVIFCPLPSLSLPSSSTVPRCLLSLYLRVILTFLTYSEMSGIYVLSAASYTFLVLGRFFGKF